jgi:hypothetical protein
MTKPADGRRATPGKAISAMATYQDTEPAALNKPSSLARAAKAILRVGDGRGFIVEHRSRRSVGGQQWTQSQRLVITAAHCLPGRLPRAASFFSGWERTYQRLLGPLGRKRPQVPAECVFIDPIADIAVLGSPDDQGLWEEAEAYDALIEPRPALRAGAISDATPVWVMRLDGYWMRLTVNESGGALWHEHSEVPTEGGMSGSPIINAAGLVVGVHTCTHGPDPCPLLHLPVWLARGIRGRPARAEPDTATRGGQ